MSKFTDQEKVESYLQRDLTDREALMLDYIISVVSDDIKTYTGRNWKDLGDETDTEEEVRAYNGTSYPELFIDDFEEVSKIEYLDTLGYLYQEIPVADYLLYPTGTVKNSITLRGSRFPRGNDNIRVTGKFTSGPVPDIAILAATRLVAEYMQSSSTSEEFKSESIEGYSYERMGDKDRIEKVETILSSLDRARKIIF